MLDGGTAFMEAEPGPRLGLLARQRNSMEGEKLESLRFHSICHCGSSVGGRLWLSQADTPVGFATCLINGYYRVICSVKASGGDLKTLGKGNAQGRSQW